MKRLVLLLTAVGALLFVGCNGNESSSETVKESKTQEQSVAQETEKKSITGTIIKEVGDEAITEERVEFQLSKIPQEYKAQYDTPEGREGIVERIAELKMLKMHALDKGIDQQEDFVFEMESAKEQILAQKLIENYFEENIVVSDEAILEKYNENKEKYKQEEQVLASHILIEVNEDMSDEEKASAKQKALEILETVDVDSFGATAKESSSCPSSENNGSLGWFSRGQMVGPFETAAFEGEKGEVYPELVETQFGYHIIYVEDKKTNSYKPVEEVEDQIREEIANTKKQAAYQELMEELRTKYNYN